MAQLVNIYVAPITLGFTPADEDLIRGTVNGVEVSGKWVFNGVTLFDSSENRICSVGFNGAQSVLIVKLPSAPTTDYELHLYRYTPEGIVQIPQRYVDGLEETTANANQALEKATAAQSTANTAQSTANTAKSTAEEAKTASNDALTKKNGGISESVIGGSLIKAYGSEETYATLDYQGLKFFRAPNAKLITRIESNGYSVFGNIDSKHILIGPGINSSNIPYISVSTKDEYITIESDGSITVVNPEKTFTLRASAIVINRFTSNGLKKIKITIGDDARPTFTDISNPNNTWTPGDNLPIVTASDKGKFLRVSESGVWTAEEGTIINSSTSGSTKKFKITVDDTGTLSATEVT